MARTTRHGHMWRALLLPALSITADQADAQGTTVQAAAFDGVVVAGYVHHGMYVNFTGPNVNLVKGRHKLIVGMMPSLRIKEDVGETRNAPVTPALGCGLTYCFGHVAVQLPFYYDPKTATANGRWHPGIGVGVRLK